MRVLIVIPAYNEAENIERVAEDLRVNYPQYDYIIVNDGSKDDTAWICKRNAYPLLDLPINLGLAGGVQAGFQYAYEKGYDAVLQFDGDGQHDAVYLEAMSKVLEKEQNDMVIGSRFITKEGFQSSGLRRVGIRYFAFLTKLLFGQKITDATSGMRMCNRKVMKLFIKDYPRDYPEPESVARLLRYKCRIKEIPVVMHEREAGVSSISLKKSGYYMIKVSLAILIERLR